MTAPTISLSPRERDVLAHLAAGRTSREAGRALKITVVCAQTYRRNLRRKVGDTAMADLPALAKRLGVEVAP